MSQRVLRNMLSGNDTIYMNRIVEPMQQEPHFHEFLELEYVISGTGVHRVGNSEVPVSGGYVFFTNFYTPHCLVPIIYARCSRS